MNDNDSLITCTPPEILEKCREAKMNMLPTKSIEIYEKQHKNFLLWCKKNNVNKKFSENVLVGYFADLAKKYAASTLWSYYSMIKATLRTKNDVDISQYTQLIAFLKQKGKNHIFKQSKTLSQQEIITFLLNAPDEIYLMMKVGYFRKLRYCF